MKYIIALFLFLNVNLACADEISITFDDLPCQHDELIINFMDSKLGQQLVG